MPRTAAPGLTKDLIRDVALAVIDEEGLPALSMRKLASRLGVQAASLYSHFANKGAVLDAVANLITRKVDTSGFEEGWQRGLLVWGRSYLAALRAHPNAAPVVAAGTGERADFLAMANAVHGGLLRHGWPPRHATMVAASVKYLVMGAATTPFGSGFADDTTVYLGRYPHLVQAHMIAQHAEEIDADSFELALQSLVAGLQAVYAEVGGLRPKPDLTNR